MMKLERIVRQMLEKLETNVLFKSEKCVIIDEILIIE